MGVVDTIMVGSLGPTAIGAVSVGHIFVDFVTIVGIGLLLGLDTVVSQSYGAGNMADCDHSLWQGLFLAVAFTPVGMLSVYSVEPALTIAGVQPDVVSLAVPYAFSLQWSVLPLMLYAAFRRYLQGISLVKPVMFALITANIVNAIANWRLIPDFGVEGAGWATTGARVYMALVLGFVILSREPAFLRHIPKPDLVRVRELLRLGVPAAGQILLETGVFAASTLLAGRLAPEALAAHHVILNIVGTTFMVPLGISSAGAVTVGQAIGRGDKKAAKLNGWLAIDLASAFMLFSAAVFAIFPLPLITLFTNNSDVLEIAVPLLAIGAVFQLFDGIQVAATGVLRGAGNTRTPMLFNLMGHWLLGLPIGYLLCFNRNYGAFGLWLGLSIGLIVVGVALVAYWAKLRLQLRSSLQEVTHSS